MSTDLVLEMKTESDARAIVKEELHMVDSNIDPNKLRTYRIGQLVEEYGF